MQIDRDTITGFSRRVKTNLDFITVHRSKNADVHEVTQLIISLLGLIVYPYEAHKNDPALDFKSVTLVSLEKAGWPRWDFYQSPQPPRTLRQLLRRLRNALAHRRIKFSSDSRKLEEVDVELWDEDKDGDDQWVARINGAQLRDFAFRLADLIDNRLNPGGAV